MGRVSVSTLLSVVVVGVGLAVIALVPDGLPARQMMAFGLVFLTIGLFAIGKLAEYLTSLLFFLIAILFSIAPPSVVFSGFQSTAFWLVFGGLVIGVALNTTGLGARIAIRISGRLRGGYLKLVTAMVCAGVVFAFLMPSAMGRSLLLIPIALALAEHFGFSSGSRGRTGLVLAITLGTLMPAFTILPANVPNMVFVGLAETQLGITVLFAEYLILHFPVLGFVKSVILIFAINYFYAEQPSKPLNGQPEKALRMARSERVLAIVLAVLLTLWLTDFAHHVSPAWIALGGALFLLLPGIGVVDQKTFSAKINMNSLLFVAGVLGVGAVIEQTGLGDTLGGRLVAWLPLEPGEPFKNYMAVAAATTVTAMAATMPGVPAVYMSLTEEIARLSGFPVKTALMLQVLGFSTVVFAYQTAPLVVALQVAGLKVRDCFRLILVMAAITIVVLLPLNFLWWRLLGWL